MKPLDVMKNPEPDYLDAEFATQEQVDAAYPPVPEEEVRALVAKYFTNTEIEKALSAAFGSRSKRRAQLVSRLKQNRTYDQPVRGGTGKQYRTRRKRFGKHADHDQSTHGNWAKGFRVSVDLEPEDQAGNVGLFDPVSGRRVAQLEWLYGEVIDLWVIEPLQRQGLATGMWNEALKHFPDLSHGPEDSQTEKGAKWVASLAERKRFGKSDV